MYFGILDRKSTSSIEYILCKTYGFFIHVQDLVRFRYRRYRQCCDDIVSISTIDFPYTSTCTYDVYIDNVVTILCWYRQIDFLYNSMCMYKFDIVDIDNVLTISYRYRQLTFHTPLYVHTMSISSISTILWRYHVDIDNWILINPSCIYN
jgi:hypothetical protein